MVDRILRSGDGQSSELDGLSGVDLGKITADASFPQLTRINTCESSWYRTYWGFYWGRWYRVASPGVDVMRTGCGAWRTVLAFSFVAMMLYLLSGFLVSFHCRGGNF